MAKAVLMPKQGQSVETCILTEWHKKVGDKVQKGDLLFAYETDKAAFEEEADADGILLEIFFQEGDEVPVLTNIAVIGEKGESINEFLPDGAQASEPTPQEEPVKTQETTKPVEEKTVEAPVVTGSEQATSGVSPRAKNKAEKHGVSLSGLTGSGPKGRIIERDVDKAIEAGNVMTPAAKEAAKSEAVPSGIQGSGMGGRITSSDLSGTGTTAAPVASGDSVVTPLSNIRKIIAQNMQASLQNSAQLTHHMSADARKLLALRAKFKADAGKTGANVTINDLVCYAVIKALKAQPEINAHFLGDSMRKFNKVHLGIAVDTERGLMVPALRNADDLNIYGLSSQLKQLAENCKTGKINPELLASTAASFTVSNLGAFGVEIFTPVINLPQSGILGVNTIIMRPADLGDGTVGIVPFLGLSLTYDHRALDGAPASAFLREIKIQIENLDYNLIG